MKIKKVMIVGAGIGGLCAAITLQQNGLEAIVYEKAENLGEVGAGLTLWSNAIKVLRTLGLADQVIDRDPNWPIHSYAPGTETYCRIFPRIRLRRIFGEPVVAIHRSAIP